MTEKLSELASEFGSPKINKERFPCYGSWHEFSLKFNLLRNDFQMKLDEYSKLVEKHEETKRFYYKCLEGLQPVFKAYVFADPSNETHRESTLDRAWSHLKPNREKPNKNEESEESESEVSENGEPSPQQRLEEIRQERMKKESRKKIIERLKEDYPDRYKDFKFKEKKDTKKKY
ncbi:Oidioi.mRNA.OKI2018_I69.PAR.g8508.t1.cds [Oikopleura dioica]|uniref:Oidioi.mRNA.OKI2018_I69.PAR.g8508.t1.cds n=1 Tax=Oikopleura dioica TaxID=34765 RepID=A0ABN7RHD0_OIKDI|nr:Oidioi.mRNA.OKI2018_I69.PAR.g8508.t1.cds [Oikopleura dioica]